MKQGPNFMAHLQTLSGGKWVCKRLTSLNYTRLVATISLLTILMTGGFQTSNAFVQSHAISLAVPESLVPLFRDVVLPRFQESNPDLYVELRIVSNDSYRDLQLPTSSDALKTFLDATADLISRADVHFLYPNIMSSENTRAGYFLDLSPLVATDASLQTTDFVPSMTEAFKWDGGQWALPVLVMPIVMVYDPAALDAAALTYPTESWTLDDFAHAARLLAHDNAPGMQVSSFDLPAFFRILAGQRFADESSVAQPNFSIAKLESLVEQWTDLEKEGVVTSGFNEGISLQFTRINALRDHALRGSLLAGQAGADVFSVAISSGTLDPDAAYQLAVYLTTVPELATITPSVLPVRYSVQNQYIDSQESLPVEALALRQTALENALAPADLQFGHYLNQAVTLIATGQPVDAALQDAQITANTNLRDAEAIRATIRVEVPAAVLPTLTDGKTTKFGLFTGGTGLSNRAQWQAVMDEFVTKTPEVSQIEFNFIPSSAGYWDEIPKQDCTFGYPYTEYTTDKLLPLDPLLNADPNFDSADVIGDVMLEMQRDGNIYGIPASVSPYVLRYSHEFFARAGIAEPDGTWTVNAFIDALHQLDAITEDPPLFLELNYSTPWELLMAAYGAAPVDYTTSPPTLRLIDKEVVSVAQQVLDLAKSGLIGYVPMATFFGNGASPSSPPPLMVVQLSDPNSANSSNSYSLVTFPIGTNTTPISFYTTSGFIFAHAAQPEVCYHLLREITRHPELFEGMPAYHSVIDSSTSQAIYGEDGIATFQRFADLMEAPNRVFIRSYGLGIPESLFMNRAFDRYVLDGADLEAEMALAQELTAAYRTCTLSNDDIVDCLLEADPTIRENLPRDVLGNR